MNKIMLMGAGFLGIKKLSSQDRKKTAEWGFLFSVVFIAPLFFMSGASEVFKIAMQLMWGACVSRAAIMANDSWKKNKSQ